MICSDESSINNSSYNPNDYVFRDSNERLLPELVNTVEHVKPTISQMWWAGIWRTGRTSIIPMKRDPLAPKNGFSSWSYQIALRDGLLPYYNKTRLFQQDNASIHCTEDIARFIYSYVIQLLEWPPNSPDLSPIENLWHILKRDLKRLFPHLKDLKNNRPNQEEFKRCVIIAWDAIPQETIRKLMDSMRNRLCAVRDARGWYTKY